jgi:thiamine biosynthesis lipoprotein
MKETRLLMGMPIIIEIIDEQANKEIFEKAFEYLEYVNKTFSPFKADSEISKINRKEIIEQDWSEDVKEVFLLAKKTKEETEGYFDIVDNNGKYNPSGIVKGWAILNTAKLIKELGAKNFYVNAGGDVQFFGKNDEGKLWKTGIKNPFNQKEIVKVVYLKDGEGIATSGNYIRGDHIYNPKDRHQKIEEIVSFTVIGPDVCEADRFATAVFAMGKEGINFLNKMPKYAGYMIDKNGVASMTNNFNKYSDENAQNN